MWTKTEDGSIVDDAGKVIFFSTERFVRDICHDACCFICGAHSGSTLFNEQQRQRLSGSAAASLTRFAYHPHRDLFPSVRGALSMQELGTFEDARAKVLDDVRHLIQTVREVTSPQIDTVEFGIAVLGQLRNQAAEDLNQIQHEFMIIRAAEWLVDQDRYPATTTWYWNPRQTGVASEPDLRGIDAESVLLSCEITTSIEPKGKIDERMRDTLRNLSGMQGALFYFTASDAMAQRARTKVRKAGWDIEVVSLLPELLPNAM